MASFVVLSVSHAFVQNCWLSHVEAFRWSTDSALFGRNSRGGVVFCVASSDLQSGLQVCARIALVRALWCCLTRCSMYSTTCKSTTRCALGLRKSYREPRCSESAIQHLDEITDWSCRSRISLARRYLRRSQCQALGSINDRWHCLHHTGRISDSHAYCTKQSSAWCLCLLLCLRLQVWFGGVRKAVRLSIANHRHHLCRWPSASGRHHS